MQANIENFKELLNKANGNKTEMQKAFDRITSYLASSVLGREFNETIESYLNRKPNIKEVHDWSKKVVISQKFTIIAM